ncbi:Nn.00g024670.m01.CDS01 [Neocucurbitaria sp. VM-36]
MRSVTFALATSAMAADVSVVWRHEKPSGSTSLIIHSSKDHVVLAESCGNSIASLDFSHVDEHGAGNFTVGGNTFDVSSKLQMADDEAKASFDALQSRNVDAMVPATPVEQGTTPSKTFRLRGRQQCYDQTGTAQIGDGDPHQNYHHKQLSEVTNCGAAPSCSAGYEVFKSYTIGWTAGISADSWISAGFEVQESWKTGNEYTCYGASGDDVCIWYNTAHTAYTVHNWAQNTCNGGPKRYSDPFVMKPPNKANRGGVFSIDKLPDLADVTAIDGLEALTANTYAEGTTAFAYLQYTVDALVAALFYSHVDACVKVADNTYHVSGFISCRLEHMYQIKIAADMFMKNYKFKINGGTVSIQFQALEGVRNSSLLKVDFDVTVPEADGGLSINWGFRTIDVETSLGLSIILIIVPRH